MCKCFLFFLNKLFSDHLSAFTWSNDTKQKLAWGLEPALSTEADSTADFVFLLRRLETIR